MTSKTGVVNNVIQVKTTDFEVFDALRIDSQDSADLSGTATSMNPLRILLQLTILFNINTLVYKMSNKRERKEDTKVLKQLRHACCGNSL